MSPPRSVSVTTVVAADPTTTFQAFTEDVDRWWRREDRYHPWLGHSGELRFEPGVGGRFLEWHEQEGEVVIGRILDWDPPQRLRFEWRLPGFGEHQGTDVEIRFEATATGTRVTLEHRGWESVPDGHAVFHGFDWVSFKTLELFFWGDLVNALARHLREDDLSTAAP